MKKAIASLFVIALFVLAFAMASGLTDGGLVSYDFVVTENVEDYTEKDYSSVVSEIKQNETDAEKEETIPSPLTFKQSYVANKQLDQGEINIIKQKTEGIDVGKKFDYKDTEAKLTVSVKGKEYYWAKFYPKMQKISGKLLKKKGGKTVEEKSIIIVFPKPDPEDPKKIAGEVKAETGPEKPAPSLKSY